MKYIAFSLSNLIFFLFPGKILTKMYQMAHKTSVKLLVRRFVIRERKFRN